jgi:hypothetical protein
MKQHTCILQDVTQQSHMLQPCLKQEMTLQMRFCVHLVVEFCAGSSNVILQSVQKLYDQTK